MQGHLPLDPDDRPRWQGAVGALLSALLPSLADQGLMHLYAGSLLRPLAWAAVAAAAEGGEESAQFQVR